MEQQYETYAALSGPLHDTHSSRALALLLLRLDRLLSDASANYQHDVVSIEHVMPSSQHRTASGRHGCRMPRTSIARPARQTASVMNSPAAKRLATL